MENKINRYSFFSNFMAGNHKNIEMRQNNILAKNLTRNHLETEKFRRNQLRSKSLSTLSVKSSEMYQAREGCDKGWNRLLSDFFKYTEYPVIVYAITSLLISSGLRISEVLSIGSCDIMQGYKVRVKGLKGSNNRIVQIVDYFEFWNKFRTFGSVISEDVNRQYLYRIYKKKGLYFMLAGGKNYRVTHSFRHKYAEMLESEGLEIEDIALELGHKNIKSTTYYVNFKNKK
jgi:integrase/recombinase XerD